MPALLQSHSHPIRLQPNEPNLLAHCTASCNPHQPPAARGREARKGDTQGGEAAAAEPRDGAQRERRTAEPREGRARAEPRARGGGLHQQPLPAARARHAQLQGDGRGARALRCVLS